MNDTTTALPVEASGYDITRFNALRHGVLSRYTVLPWENADEYRALVAALAADHDSAAGQGVVRGYEFP